MLQNINIKIMSTIDIGIEIKDTVKEKTVWMLSAYLR